MANKPGQYIAWCCSKHIASKTKDCSRITFGHDASKSVRFDDEQIIQQPQHHLKAAG
jgi:hypothetical protein